MTPVDARKIDNDELTLKTMVYEFSHEMEDRSLRVEQLVRWLTGDMPQRLSDAYMRFLVNAIHSNKVTVDDEHKDVVADIVERRYIRRPLTVGPGEELRKLFLSINVIAKTDCNCQSIIQEMNQLGSAGCRRERQRLVAAIKTNAHHYAWREKLAAAAAIIRNGGLLEIDLRDPIGSCFDKAVARWDQISMGASR